MYYRITKIDTEWYPSSQQYLLKGLIGRIFRRSEKYEYGKYYFFKSHDFDDIIESEPHCKEFAYSIDCVEEITVDEILKLTEF